MPRKTAVLFSPAENSRAGLPSAGADGSHDLPGRRRGTALVVIRCQLRYHSEKGTKTWIFNPL